ncbi:DNA cytosine methyltransferase [Nocardia farcinica]|uniref:DNA cytosine methyltransferase n=1 Tax=Nocardia farcinica TaxID=37329 RepID=UPI00189637AA|nr:DNA cytosine methyltransferase [Nocardia farcinica]MBF6254047.1 DNA (cytosine-5-)-methyltransferase [Nocardia farcinica]
MPRSVELFAGGGGMALGMFNAGFEHEQLIEWDPRACNILKVNAERSPDLWKKENVRNMDVLEWLKEAPGLGLADIDLVAGGPPCQPFSISGAHAGDNDKRNMFPAAVETVRTLRPKCFVFENVPGLLRPSFKPYYDYIVDQLSKPSVKPKAGEHWAEHHKRIMQTKRAGLTYRVHRQVIEAANVGVPQTRKRVFLVGIRTDVSGWDRWTDISPTHDRDALLRDQWIVGSYWTRHEIKRPSIPEIFRARVEALRGADELFEREPWQTTRDALMKAPKLPKPRDGKDAPDVLNHRGIPGARTYPGHQGSWIDWPAKTLKAGVHGVAGGEGMIRFHNGSVRYLTVRESARIQTFPDTYEIPGTRTAAMRALGNAVAVDVAEIIGKKLRAVLNL